jgi:hypothetical protein
MAGILIVWDGSRIANSVDKAIGFRPAGRLNCAMLLRKSPHTARQRMSSAFSMRHLKRLVLAIVVVYLLPALASAGWWALATIQLL